MVFALWPLVSSRRQRRHSALQPLSKAHLICNIDNDTRYMSLPLSLSLFFLSHTCPYLSLFLIHVLTSISLFLRHTCPNLSPFLSHTCPYLSLSLSYTMSLSLTKRSLGIDGRREKTTKSTHVDVTDGDDDRTRELNNVCEASNTHTRAHVRHVRQHGVDARADAAEHVLRLRLSTAHVRLVAPHKSFETR